MRAHVHLRPPLPDESFRLLAEVAKKYRLGIGGRPNVFSVQGPPDASEAEVQRLFEAAWYTAGEFCRRNQTIGHGFGLVTIPKLGFVPDEEEGTKMARRVAARHVQAAYFSVGDIVLFGKYKNKRGKVVAFGEDKWGNPTIEIEPVPKGRKQNKVFGLYKVWRADVKEKALAEQAKTSYDRSDDDDGGDHDFDD